MVGRELTRYYMKDNVPSSDVILKVENLSYGKMVKKVDFFVRRGEILGIAGLVGAGRSETMECIFGLTKRTGGQVWIEA